MSAVGTTDSGPLSVNQAIDELNAAEAAAAKKPEKAARAAPAAATDAPSEEEAPAGVLEVGEQIEGAAEDAGADELAAPEAEDGEAEEPGDVENEEDQPEGTPQVEPPRWWSKDKKELFKQLSPELQAVVHEQEETREKVVSKVKQESADAKKAADERTVRLDHQLGVIVPLVVKAQEVFKGRWEGVDWAVVAQQAEPQEYNRLRAEFEKETFTLNHLQLEAERLESQQTAEFRVAEVAKLKTVAPDLVDEKLGVQRRRAVSSFLTELQFPANRIQNMSAEEAALAYDAMRWRQANKNASQNSLRPKPPAQNRPAARPTAVPAKRAPETARAQALEKAFNANPSKKNLEAWMNAKG